MASADPELSKKSIFTYHRVVLFNYNVQAKKPFASYNRSMFGDEIPQSWFLGPLTPQNRRKILSLPALGGGRFSVFAKIELGELIGINLFSIKYCLRNAIFDIKINWQFFF